MKYKYMWCLIRHRHLHCSIGRVCRRGHALSLFMILPFFFLFLLLTSLITSHHTTSQFVDDYAMQEPPFGFNGLGELVYRRTYSRLKPDGAREQWFETVERVRSGWWRGIARELILLITLQFRLDPSVFRPRAYSFIHSFIHSFPSYPIGD